MTDRYRQQWEALGAGDPYWAVITDSRKKGGKWGKGEFFQTGTDEINSVLEKISHLGIQLRLELALDYGCGVGRLSRALSILFRQVIGVDISDSMLSEARSVNVELANIEFLRNNGYSLDSISDETVDLVYTNIVLQHTPRNNQRSLIKEFCRVLRRGGVLVFQTPSHQNMRTIKGVLHFLLGNRILNIIRRIKHGKLCVMEMHTIRKHDVLRLLREEGMTITDAERYDSAGISFISYRYFAVKT
jgi:ubiquinone/menaquinone biosynthesis C-methylase UbiE